MLSNCDSFVVLAEPQRGPKLREEDGSRRVNFEVNYRKENAPPTTYKFIPSKEKLLKAQKMRKKTWIQDAKRE